MTKKKKKRSANSSSPRSFFISISQLANNRARSQTRFSFSWWTRGKNFNGTVSFVGRRSRNVFLGRIGPQSDLYTSRSPPTNPFWPTSLPLSFSFHGLFHDRRTGDPSIFANSKYGNQMSQFPGIRGMGEAKLGLNRRSCVVQYVFDRFPLGYVPFVPDSVFGENRKYFISFDEYFDSVNDAMQ